MSPRLRRGHPEAAVGTDGTAAPAGATAAAPAADAPRFRSLQLPSAPFWVALVAILVAATVLVIAAPALFVFAIGTALAFFLVPIVNRLERAGLPRALAAILVVVILVVVTLVVLGISAFILVEQGVTFVQQLPTYLADARAAIDTLNLPAWAESAIDGAAGSAGDGMGALDPSVLIAGFLQGLLGVVGLLFSFMLLPFFLFYLLKDQPRMAKAFNEGIPLPWKRDVEAIIGIVLRDLATFFRAEVTVGAIMFLIVSIGMALIGWLVPGAEVLLHFALLLGLCAGILEAIPQIGPILSYIPALLLAVGAGPQAVIAVSIFYFLAFNFEGSVLVPMFEGQIVSFSGASVLVIIAIGFALGGLIGAIVALPVAAIVRDTFGLFFRRAQEMAGVPPAAAAEPATT